MKKRKILMPLIFILLVLCAMPEHAASREIHSLTLSTHEITKNSYNMYYALMCKNKLEGYSTYRSNQHKVLSETLTTEQFNKLLDDAFKSSTDNDLNFFYFTGHTIFEDSRPLGINLDKENRTYYAYELLAKKLNLYKGKMIVILDTCGSEAFIVDGINKLRDKSRISALCSCGYYEESELGYIYPTPYYWDALGVRHNAFTYALGKGLGYFTDETVYADVNNNGNVSLQELYEYVRKNVRPVKKVNVKMFSLNSSSNIFSYGGPRVSIKLSETSCSIVKGKTRQLRATITGTTRKPSWSSSNSSVASVNSKGKITAKKKGTAVITCKVGSKKVTCRVTVKNSSIKLNRTNVTLYTSDRKTVSLSASVQGASSKVVWKSSNTSIATVTSKGKVTAKRAGTATISAKANGATAKCKVTVKKGDSATYAYKEYLKRNLKNRYYAIVNAGQNKKPILIVAPSKFRRISKYDGYSISVYGYQNGKVRKMIDFIPQSTAAGPWYYYKNKLYTTGRRGGYFRLDIVGNTYRRPFYRGYNRTIFKDANIVKIRKNR